MKAWNLVVALGLVAMAIPLAADASTCNPYPVGRCGDFDREQVTFCYRVVAGRMIDASDHHVLALATSEGVALPDNTAKGILYLRMTPSETFVDDPYESDLPFESLILETNTIRGVQLLPFKCGQFIWYAECDSWMGPYNIQPQGQEAFQADRVVV